MNNKILFGITATIITTILTISLQIEPIQAKSTDSWYDLEKKKNWEQVGFDFGIKILDNWAWQKSFYEGSNIMNLHMNSGFELYPNNFENKSVVYGMIAKDGYYTLKNSALNTYSNYKKNTPDWGSLTLESTKLLKETDIIISDQPGKKLEYQNDALNLKITLYLTLYNGEPFIGLYQALNNYYATYLPQYEQILQSITWVDSEEEEEEDEFS